MTSSVLPRLILSSLILFCLSCWSFNKKTTVRVIKVFDGTELITDTNYTAGRYSQHLFLAGELYSIELENDTVPFFCEKRKIAGSITLAVDSIRNINNTPNKKLRELIELTKLIQESISITTAGFTDLNERLTAKKISFKAYADRKAFLDATGQRYIDSLKEQLWTKMQDSSIANTIIPAYIISCKIGDRRIFSLKEDLSRYISVAETYQRLSSVSQEQDNFIIYVRAYREFLAEEMKKDSLLSPGRSVGELNLPDINGRYISLQHTCRQKPLTMLLFVRNTCEYCNEERQYIHRNYSDHKALSIYEVTIDEPGSHSDWVRVIKAGKLYPWVQVLDTSAHTKAIISRFNVTSTPISFLLNSKGQIVSRNPTRNDIDSILSKN